MSMMLELSSRMIDYLPEEVAKIQRTLELALSESKSEDEMFSLVDQHLTTKHLREGAREFWDVFSNASDYAEPLTEGVGGFPVDRANILKNRAKDRNIGRVMDVNGQQVLVINKRSNGDYVVVDKMGKRSVKKGEGLGTTKTETIELNVLDTIEEEDMSASEAPNGAKKKSGSGKTVVVINPKASDLMKEAKKEDKKKKPLRWQDSDGDGKWYEPGQDVKVKKEETEIDTDLTEDKDPCWKGYQMVGMKKKGGREVPNCVPKEEYEDLVNELISEGYDDEAVHEVLAAIEEGMEVVFEENGYSIISEETLEEQFYEDVELVANWLQEEGIIETEDEFFSLMNDLNEEEIDELYTVVIEATAMAKRGYDEAPIRQKIAKSTGGGAAADRATKLADKSTFGDAKKAKQRQDLARKQRGDFRNTTSSSPGLHGYAHKSDDPKVKAKQAARGAQRGALTPAEKKQFNREDFELWVNALVEEGYDLSEYTWDEMLDIYEAEGSYGETPKAYAAASKTKMTAKRKPFLKAMQRRTNPANRKDAYASPRKGLTADDRERARAGSAHGVGTRQDHDYPSEGPGGVTKNPKKLRKQKAMGEFAKENIEMIGDSLEEGGMEVRTYSWREVMGEAWKGSKKGGKNNGSC
jgi:hypothetical protein